MFKELHKKERDCDERFSFIYFVAVFSLIVTVAFFGETIHRYAVCESSNFVGVTNSFVDRHCNPETIRKRLLVDLLQTIQRHAAVLNGDDVELLTGTILSMFKRQKIATCSTTPETFRSGVDPTVAE